MMLERSGASRETAKQCYRDGEQLSSLGGSRLVRFTTVDLRAIIKDILPDNLG
jgi:hypothetical protein